MEFLDYIKLAQKFSLDPAAVRDPSVRIAIVTNFTDDILAKIITGRCLAEGIVPDVYQVPFKQYLFALKDSSSDLYLHKPEVTFVLFDVNAYQESEFLHDTEHHQEVLHDIEHFSTKVGGLLVLHTLLTPSRVQHHRLLKDNDVSRVVHEFNMQARELAHQNENIVLLDVNLLLSKIGEWAARDLRELYAHSIAFSNTFFMEISLEWVSVIRSKIGHLRKCIVLDLDNVLWGGVLGEVGPLGIALHHEYPGNAFRSFQKVLLSYYERGIILAINSRNNPEDVDEVFAKNKNMILQKDHFAAFAINWKSKAENMATLARELNIGLDAMVFIDDDPVNRELVRSQYPEVLVPEFSLPPEEYAKNILDLDAFHAFAITEEDKQRGQMYAQERQRKEVASAAPDLGSYMRALGVEIRMYQDAEDTLTRVSQLTQKTNQFNLTTVRLTDHELRELMKNGAMVFAGDVSDKFGPYGITIVAIVLPQSKTRAALHTYLMSCRVMGRGVEDGFLAALANTLRESGLQELELQFSATAKNAPARDFFQSVTGEEITGTSGKAVMSTEVLAQRTSETIKITNNV